jgi:hypothetical protein
MGCLVINKERKQTYNVSKLVLSDHMRESIFQLVEDLA